MLAVRFWPGTRQLDLWIGPEGQLGQQDGGAGYWMVRAWVSGAENMGPSYRGVKNRDPRDTV